jgi:hypothetical protein
VEYQCANAGTAVVGEAALDCTSMRARSGGFR